MHLIRPVGEAEGAGAGVETGERSVLTHAGTAVDLDGGVDDGKRCGRCGPNGTARRLATLMHAVQSSSPEAAAAIGKPSSKWFQQRPSLFVLKAVKGGQQVVTRAAEVVERRENPIRALIRSFFKVLGSPFALIQKLFGGKKP